MKLQSQLSRREFLHWVQALGGVAAATAFLDACGVVEISETPQSQKPKTGEAPPSASLTADVSNTPESSETPRFTETTSPASPQNGFAQVSLVKTTDRVNGVRRAIDLLGSQTDQKITGANVLLKPNFNSADPTPGSTHPEVLRTLVLKLQEKGANQITLGDRSGMGNTRQVMQALGVFNLAEELGFETLVFDDLPLEAWKKMNSETSHWQQGFLLPNICLESDAVVQTCCLKTHRFGGVFTLSLKNSVGLAAKYHPVTHYNYMNELHSSNHQRRMIAEINSAYQPALIVLDGVDAFISGGPDKGEKVSPGVILAGNDRIAIDAVGVAILKKFGANMPGKIFEQEQIARAVELKLGIDGPGKIQFITDDQDSLFYAREIEAVFREQR